MSRRAYERNFPVSVSPRRYEYHLWYWQQTTMVVLPLLVALAAAARGSSCDSNAIVQ
jgi:hypothetical protein